MSHTIGYIVGSISSTSINRKLAEALARLAPDGIDLVEVPIADLPFYSPDADTDFPAAAREFKRALADVDGVLIVTPEYSRSIPGVLKNALDWASRPYGQGSFDGKPTAVIGTSGGPISTAVAQQHLKTILAHFNAIQLGQPEGYIQFTPDLIAEDGTIGNEGSAEFLTGFLQALDTLISRHEAATAALAS